MHEVRANVTPACASAGTLPPGSPCHINSQCASYVCAGGGVGTCGYCTTLAPPDGGCNDRNVSCPQNQLCDGTSCTPRVVESQLEPGDICPVDGGVDCPFDEPCSAAAPMAEAGTCQRGPAAGAACRYRVSNAQGLCDDATCALNDGGGALRCSGPHALNEVCGSRLNVDCQAGLYCDNPVSGTCKARRGVSEPCGGANGECQTNHFCAFTSAAQGTCKASAKLGELCPNVPIDGGAGAYATACVVGTRCVTVPGPTDGSVQRTCVAGPAAIGEACDAPIKPCAAGIVCNAQKICELPPCLPRDAGTD